MAEPGYCGRFAPSPTGPLHFGSLVTAMASYLEARARHGRWLLRIDDLDQTRCVPGMAGHIMRTLEAFGMHWDGRPAWQSRNQAAYQAALERLRRDGRLYHCRCSRRQVAAAATRSGPEGPIYPGTCRGLDLGPGPGRATRIRVDDTPIRFEDGLFGPQTQNLSEWVGDFVVHRADGYFAYQLAVVVDDHLAGINQVVRGADLLASTARQLWLHDLLGQPRPRHLHVPLVLGPDGKKLSKRDAAHPVDPAQPLPDLLAAWTFLGQTPPQDRDLSVEEFWQWALPLWQPERMKQTESRDERTTDPL